MAFYECKVGGSGGGIPPQLQTDMDSVLNKKLGTSTTYPSTSWAKEVNLMGLLPEKTVSGAVASFADGADDVPIKSATFDIDPTLTGVSAVNVVQQGKNLFNPSTVFTATGSYMYAKSIFPKNTNLICKFVDKDPTVDISGIYFGFYDDTYTSGAASSGHYRWLINNGTVQSNLSNMASGGGSVLCDGLFAFPKNQTTIDTVLARYDIQVEVGTVSTDYVAYTAPETRTISLGQTVYGGSVTVDEEGNVTLAEGWKLYTGSWTHYASSNGFKAYRSTVTARAKYTNTAIDNIGNVFGSFNSSNMTQNQIQLPTNSVTNFYLALDENEDPDEVILVYQEYDEPTQTDLDPITPITSALGVNNIWCDTGDVETLTYRADIALALNS